MPRLPATASIEPSGEYVISFTLPLPKRALAPSGKLSCVYGSYCAKQGRILRLEIMSSVKIKKSFVCIFMDACLLYWLSVVRKTGYQFSVFSYQLRGY